MNCFILCFQLQCAEAIGLAGKSLSLVYFSIAVTYADFQQYDKALEYYKKELETRQGDLKEVLNLILKKSLFIIEGHSTVF